MDALFRWTMRNGAKLIFTVALLHLLYGLLLPLTLLLSETRRMAANLNYSPGGDLDTLFHLSNLISSVGTAAFLLIGALLVDRVDRWFALRDGEDGG